MVRAFLSLVVTLGVFGCDKGDKTKVPGGGDLSVLPALYAEGSDAPQAVRKECQFEQEVAQEVVENVADAKISTGGTSGKVLTLEVVTMRGVDPTYQGDRRVILDGELREDGTLIGSFKITRSASGGLLGGMNDVCRSLDQVAEEMGLDIAEYLADPKEGVTL